jgi:hypothetical protein
VIGSDPVPGRYGVALVDSVTRPTDEGVRVKAEALVARHGGRITHVIADYNLFYMEATETIARSIAQDQRVKVVAQNQHLYWN